MAKRARGCLGFGVAGVLVAISGSVGRLAGQDTTLSRRLAVQPREVATATRTERAGEHEIAPAKNPWFTTWQPARVYVPPSCVGTRRCPLVVFIWGAWDEVMLFVRPMADRYGMILFVPGAEYLELSGETRFAGDDPSTDDAATARERRDAAEQQRRHLDATLTLVLQQFAIDPDKIAIVGTCATGRPPMTIGGSNMAIFSRIVSLSAGYPRTDLVGAPNPRTEFFLDAGIDESGKVFKAAQELRQQGHRVTHAVGLRVHGHTLESYDHVGRWLQTTWAEPDPAKRPVPSTLEPVPELTTEAVAKMTTFWTAFLHEPDSIRMDARRAHLRDLVVPVNKERPVVVLTDMAALAAQYPSVAAALKQAGLTAAQHDAYRAALVSARIALADEEEEEGKRVLGAPEPGSVAAKNLAFMTAYPDEVGALEDASVGYARKDRNFTVLANMWTMP